MKKNGFLTFCFSFIPGAGQMYQGYMKRGLSIMLLFGIFTGITGVAGTPILAIPIPIIFAYSFFDTFNIRNRTGEQNQIKDDYVWNDFSDKDIFKGIKEKKINNFLGVVLIVIGIYILLDSVLSNIAHRLDLYYLSNFMNIVMRYLPSALIAVLSIYFGVKLVSRKR